MAERPFPEEVIREFGERNGGLVAELIRMVNVLMEQEPQTIEEVRIHNTFRLLVGLCSGLSRHPLAEEFDNIVTLMLAQLQRDALEMLVGAAKQGSSHARELVEAIAGDPEGAAKAQAYGIALDTGS